ncbi:hypothetical protein UlMin_040038 [Ulmus minor]
MENVSKGKSTDVESSSSVSLKRSRAYNNGIQVPSCLVDGCTSDLSKCRDYHRRHKVCELHSKTPKVTIVGQEQRFCQQCSRFHSLVEFDEEKRSCRKRLDGHNKRRRKPQPEPLCLNSGRYHSPYQGTSFSPFRSPQILPSISISSALKSECELGPSGTTRKDQFPGSISLPYNAGKEFPFLQGTSSCTISLPSSLSQSLVDSNSPMDNWLYGDDNVDSNCALSLLSSTPTYRKEIGLNHMVNSNSILHRPQPSAPSLHYNAFGMAGEPLLTSVSVSDASEMCQNRPDGSSSIRPRHC